MTTFLGPQAVLSILDDASGEHHDGLGAFVSVEIEGDTAVVELTSTLDIDCEESPQRFRVTVERIGDDQ
jgi:hypothetical protein